MKLFLDTANVDEIRKANEMGVICGVTTNPSLIAKEGRDYAETLKEICGIVEMCIRDRPILAGLFCLPMPRDAVSARSLSNSYAIRWPPTECRRSGWPMCWAIRRASDSGRKMGSDPPAKRKIWAVIGLYAWSSHCNFQKIGLTNLSTRYIIHSIDLHR